MPKIRTHKTFKDKRGSFTPIELDCAPPSVDKWNQTNISINPKPFTFRGIHYQDEFPQNKYIKVIQGKILDFLFDLKTKKVEQFKLGDQEAIFVPKSQAHGFLTLEPNTIVVYLTDAPYKPKLERSIPWHKIPDITKAVIDELNPKMMVTDLIISDKDTIGK